MPRVGNKHFSYTPRGFAAARQAKSQSTPTRASAVKQPTTSPLSLPSGLASRGQLPPGLRNRTGGLPPGLAKKTAGVQSAKSFAPGQMRNPRAQALKQRLKNETGPKKVPSRRRPPSPLSRRPTSSIRRQPPKVF